MSRCLLVFYFVNFQGRCRHPAHSAIFARDKAIGSTTNWKENTNSQRVGMLCQYMGGRNVGIVNGTLVSGYSDAYQSSNPGIGIRFRATTWYSASQQRALPFDIPGNGPSDC